MPYVIKANSIDNSWQLHGAASTISLLEQLQNHQVPIRSSCMGKGTCHQCRVRVEKGFASISINDRAAFSFDELKDGWRLSCSIKPKTNLEVHLPSTYSFEDSINILREPFGPWWIACDLGTTQVELSAVDKNGVWGEVKSLNRQISMGADVMTRLEFAQKHGIQLLQKRILQQIKKMTEILTSKYSLFQNKIYVAGNSAVTSFILNYPIENLAVSPYQPHSFDSVKITLDEVEIETLPLIYSFVGGDLFAGIFKLWIDKKAENNNSWILIDVGTNSELIFWDGERLFISSTPAGPAFEGSSISIGMRAEPGAILNPKYNDSQQKWEFDTIGNDIPKGICGSALVEMIGTCIKEKFISVDGEVLEPDKLQLTNNLSINQDDIREFQLAKSAIRTGLDLVSSEGNKNPNLLYLAGAFGSHLNLDSCIKIGLLPNMPTVTLGNLSLIGTIEWGKADCSIKLAFKKWLSDVKHPIELALRDDFQRSFITNMTLSAGN